MVRLSAPGKLRFNQADQLNIVYGGSEANVAASLARFGLEASFVSSLPKNDLGYAAAEVLAKNGVNTDSLFFQEGRIGLYFLEQGSWESELEKVCSELNI